MEIVFEPMKYSMVSSKSSASSSTKGRSGADLEQKKALTTSPSLESIKTQPIPGSKQLSPTESLRSKEHDIDLSSKPQKESDFSKKKEPEPSNHQAQSQNQVASLKEDNQPEKFMDDEPERLVPPSEDSPSKSIKSKHRRDETEEESAFMAVSMAPEAEETKEPFIDTSPQENRSETKENNGLKDQLDEFTKEEAVSLSIRPGSIISEVREDQKANNEHDVTLTMSKDGESELSNSIFTQKTRMSGWRNSKKQENETRHVLSVNPSMGAPKIPQKDDAEADEAVKAEWAVAANSQVFRNSIISHCREESNKRLIDDLNKTISEQKRSIQDMEVAVYLKENEVTKLKEELSRFRGKIQSDELKGNRVVSGEIVAQKDILESTNEKLKEEIKQLNEELSQKELEIVQLKMDKKSLVILNEQLTKKKGQKEQLVEENEMLKEELDKMLEQSKEQKEFFESEKNRLMARISEYEKRLMGSSKQDVQAIIQTYLERIDIGMDEIKALAENLMNMTMAKEDNGTRLIEAEREKQELELEIEKINARRSEEMGSEIESKVIGVQKEYELKINELMRRQSQFEEMYNENIRNLQNELNLLLGQKPSKELEEENFRLSEKNQTLERNNAILNNLVKSLKKLG